MSPRYTASNNLVNPEGVTHFGCGVSRSSDLSIFDPGAHAPGYEYVAASRLISPHLQLSLLKSRERMTDADDQAFSLRLCVFFLVILSACVRVICGFSAAGPVNHRWQRMQ